MEEDFIYKSIHQGEAELRYDILNGQWVLIASDRGKRPSDFVTEKSDVYDEQKDIFNDPVATGQEPDVLIYRDRNDDWTTRVFPNKYPAVQQGHHFEDLSQGPYLARVASGTQELVVTRDGRRSFGLLKTEELAEVIDAYQERYFALMKKRDVASINIFHNHGAKAGASIIHPHSQILTLPIVPSRIKREHEVLKKYQMHTGHNFFDIVSSYEREVGSRVVYENEYFLVYCPFASHRAYEMKVLPKTSQPFFERINNAQKYALADALGTALGALHSALEDPDFNYYIRTAPCNGKDYAGTRYYVDILPRTHVYAGFEAATDVHVVSMSPESSASHLRKFI